MAVSNARQFSKVVYAGFSCKTLSVVDTKLLHIEPVAPSARGKLPPESFSHCPEFRG